MEREGGLGGGGAGGASAPPAAGMSADQTISPPLISKP